eukprot:scaffold16105_cov50-Phaeocystis_antarctica.AAC.1
MGRELVGRGKGAAARLLHDRCGTQRAQPAAPTVVRRGAERGGEQAHELGEHRGVGAVEQHAAQQRGRLVALAQRGAERGVDYDVGETAERHLDEAAAVAGALRNRPQQEREQAVLAHELRQRGVGRHVPERAAGLDGSGIARLLGLVALVGGGRPVGRRQQGAQQREDGRRLYRRVEPLGHRGRAGS